MGHPFLIHDVDRAIGFHRWIEEIGGDMVIPANGFVVFVPEYSGGCGVPLQLLVVSRAATRRATGAHQRYSLVTGSLRLSHAVIPPSIRLTLLKPRCANRLAAMLAL
jgi:hypothetical protein